MKEKDYGVHASHCCVKHGCKYNNPDCPVVNQQIKQKYLCEYCGQDNITSLAQLDTLMLAQNHMIKYIILGRTCSGKDKFAEKLRETSLNFKKSFTTRPRRENENDDYYYFITDEEYDALPDKILETENNGYKYCTNISEIKNADVLILDPQGLYDITSLFPDVIFRILYIHADYQKRQNAYNKRNSYKTFESRNTSEDMRFKEFEDTLENCSFTMSNCMFGTSIFNDFTENSKIFKYNKAIKNQIRQFNRILQILADLRRTNYLKIDENGKILMLTQKTENSKYEETYVSDTIFAENLLQYDDGFADLVKQWLKIKDVNIV